MARDIEKTNRQAIVRRAAFLGRFLPRISRISRMENRTLLSAPSVLLPVKVSHFGEDLSEEFLSGEWARTF
jgi:hypothetical protein